MKRKLVSLLLALVCASAAHAAIIIGNLASFSNDDGQSGAGSLISGQSSTSFGDFADGFYSGKGIGFTMPATAYDLTSVTLRLDNVTGVNDAPTVSIWTSNGSNPVALVATLNSPGGYFGATNSAYVFTPAATVTLAASTSYFMVVQQQGGPAADNDFNWLNGSPTVVPTGVAASAIARFGSDVTTSAVLYNQTSGQFNWFQIEGNVSVIPEPSSFAAFAGLAALGLMASRRRRGLPADVKTARTAP
jgi:hypothetical protein